VYSTKADLIRCTLVDNVACLLGGVVTVRAGGVARFIASYLGNNMADASGGGCIAIDSPIAEVELVDTTLEGCRSSGPRSTGAAIFIQVGGGSLLARNATIRDCTAQTDSGIFVSGDPSVVTLDVTLLTFVPPCESNAHVYRGVTQSWPPGPLFRLAGAAATGADAIYSRIRGLHAFNPTGCPSPTLTADLLMSPVASLPTCTTRADHCGAEATCTADAVGSGLALTTPTCSCEGLRRPMPSPTYSAAVTTFVLGCSTPREGTGVGLTALRVQDVVFDLIKPANDSRTLTLRMGGTAVGDATWAIDALSLPLWLYAEALRGNYTSLSDEAPIVTLTAVTSGFAERPEGYEQKLRLTVHADTETSFDVPVQLKISVIDDAQRGVWGAVSAPAADGIRPACATVLRPLAAAVVDSEFRIPFTSCDGEGLPVAHALPSANDLRAFSASLTAPSDSLLAHALTIISQPYGVYSIVIAPSQLSHVGTYAVTVSLAGARPCRQTRGWKLALCLHVHRCSAS
jgi:hypothetical protein